MTTITPGTLVAARTHQTLLAATVFFSAALLFMVEPMVAKLVLPMLGGGPSVWNASMGFFQAALLVGYGYAHLLQRIPSVRRQAVVHCAIVALALLALPLRIHGAFGTPSSNHPALWLLGELTVSIGAPFAALSATAPLIQAWYAQMSPGEASGEPYSLYAASNLGSLLALVAYPIVVEPAVSLHMQSRAWSLGYLSFGVLLASVAVISSQAGAARSHPPVRRSAGSAPAGLWRDRFLWVALPAIPSSLMLGVTTYLTTDVASAPFIWVLPLSLYLLSFVIAFQARPAIPRDLALPLQAATVALCVTLLPFGQYSLPLQFSLHLAAFFFAALACHQAVVARRPPPERLTEFYLCLSLGGVVGGAFNAFIAPAVFNDVLEYPIVLTLSCLVQPWGEGRTPPRVWLLTLAAVLCAVMAPVVMTLAERARHTSDVAAMMVLLDVAVVLAFMVRKHGRLFCAVVAVLSIGAAAAADRVTTDTKWRSFFGVLRQSEVRAPELGGQVRTLAHGSTLHGAQALAPQFRCHPLLYYAPETPIGQVILAAQQTAPAIRIGAVGLGTGSVSAYVRPQDRLTFFEIDPLVIRIATDPNHFSYTSQCARGPLDYVVGDARLTLANQAPAIFDVLLIDAFSSDSVPAHLLTVEAVRGYLTHLKPGGVVILHLTNRNLDLLRPAQAVAQAAGGFALLQQYRVPLNTQWKSSEDAIVIGRTPEAVARFAADPRWKPVDPTRARPWTDDYTNLVGALWRQMNERWAHRGG